jgi:glucose/arabinose dehydrogenase
VVVSAVTTSIRWFVISVFLFGLLVPGFVTSRRIAAEDATPAVVPIPTPAFAVPGVARPGGMLGQPAAIQFVKVAEGLADPVDVTNAGDGSGRLFVVERIGRIRIVDPAEGLLADPFLDIQPLVDHAFQEQGLLGLAFHPDYGDNGLFYLTYTDLDDALVLARYTVDPGNPNRADPASGIQVLRIERTNDTGAHNGGRVRFGPDGFLYLSVGDMAPTFFDDPEENAQNLETLAGKLLRIDVDHPSGDPVYGIPADNPFAGEAGARPEIWAYGLRNPWQFSFDRETGDLWIADVGSGEWEEINFAAAGTKGGQNYGWNAMEGAHCGPSRFGECDVVGTLPVAEYSHFFDDGGNCAVTGLGVYRGASVPALMGVYVAADFCSGKIWGVVRVAGEWVMQEVLWLDLVVSGGGEDEAGELYITTCECSGAPDADPARDPSGAVWRLVTVDQGPAMGDVAPTVVP